MEIPSPQYDGEPLDVGSMAESPFEEFGVWLKVAVDSGLREPHAMALATEGPDVRMVLMKGFDEAGFVFHSHYGSQKAAQMEAKPEVALLFWWKELERQVRVRGRVERASGEESDAYFMTRNRKSRLSAWASRQSQACGSREELDAQYAEVEAEFEGKEVVRPEFWGGYRVIPSQFEFWSGMRNRLHDRVLYKIEGEKWMRMRLNP